MKRIFFGWIMLLNATLFAQDEKAPAFTWSGYVEAYY